MLQYQAKIDQQIDDTILLVNILFRSDPNLSNQIIPNAAADVKTSRILEIVAHTILKLPLS